MIVRRALATITLAAALPTAAAPSAPSDLRAVPDYGDRSIVVEWDDVSGESGYRVYRAEFGSGPLLAVSPDLPPDTLSYVDPDLDPELDYEYVVRSFDGSGESSDSNSFRQNVDVVWPNPGNRALLHGWNDTLGVAGSSGLGYHKGCDIQQTGSTQNTIVFPRGGVVARIGNQGNDNNHIYVEVRIGTERRYDSFNHLDGNNPGALGYDVGDVVRAGQVVGEIGNRFFTCCGVDWVDHVHFFTPSDPFTNAVDGQSPLKIFDSPSERDPQDQRPAITDHDDPGSGTVLYHRQGSAPGPPYLTAPLGDDRLTPIDEGDVDIHAELADAQNPGVGTTQVPTQVAYWIQGRDCDDSPAAVRDAVTPYTLLRWDDRFFLDEGVDWRDLVDEAQDLTPYIEFDGKAYPSSWNNFKHFIITNSASDDGAPGAVDAAQFWNTDARDDGSGPTSPQANFAGSPDTTRAVDARFPDGTYTIHVRTVDLVGSRSEILDAVQLDNFPPAVASSCATDDESSPRSVRIRFSEPMDQASVETGLALTVPGVGPTSFTAEWESGGCAVRIVPDLDPSPDEPLEWTLDGLTAADLTGRLLDGAFGVPGHNGDSEGATDSVMRIEPTVTFAEAGGLTLSKGAAESAALSWTDVGGPAYAITRGTLADLLPDDYGSCLANGLTVTSFEDEQRPDPNQGFFYLVQTESTVCGAGGSLGATSDGAVRVNLNPNVCF